jgi:hypothetical protein
MKSREKCLCFSVSTYLSNLLGTGTRRLPGILFIERSLDFYRTIDRKSSLSCGIDGNDS